MLYSNLVAYYSTCLQCLHVFIIKFPYNARSDWLKQRPLSENKVQVSVVFRWLRNERGGKRFSHT